jgi:hypothetical protein
LLGDRIAPARSERLFAEAIACTERSGDRFAACLLDNNAGSNALRAGDIAARAHLEQAAQVMHEIGLKSHFVACKRSGVRISLAPLVRSEIRTDRTGSTAAKYSNGGAMGRRTCVRIGIASLARLLARLRISVTALLPSGVPPGQILVPGDQ